MNLFQNVYTAIISLIQYTRPWLCSFQMSDWLKTQIATIFSQLFSPIVGNDFVNRRLSQLYLSPFQVFGSGFTTRAKDHYSHSLLFVELMPDHYD